MPTQIGVFAKHWTPGLVKTRLAASIGEQAAAEVAKAFLQTLIARIEGLADRQVIGFTPTEAKSQFSELAGPAWSLVPQSKGDLGARMHHYFRSAFDAGADRVVLLGADSPNLPLPVLKQAFSALEQSQLVLGPTDDGGYCLIGARDEPPPVLEDMPWSTSDLWRATTDRLAECGLRQGEQWVALSQWYDVDTIDDMHRLRRDLAAHSDDDHLARLAARINSLLGD